MSLLEDVFLEDEANEAQELERVIEGDEFDDRPRSRLDMDSDNDSEREGEAEEEKKRVDPSSTKTRRVIKNPRFILNPARLTGPRGIQVILEHFKDFKFKGKGHEKEDLDLVLKKLEHWAYRLYPKFKFEDCLSKIETLGKKRPVMVHLQKIRTDQYISEETVVQRDSSDDEAPQEAPTEDEFDKLLQQQIELARSTPAPSSVKKGMDSAVKENRSIMMPKATSSPSISDEQRERILKSRKLAEERRLARLKNASNIMNTTQKSDNIASTPSKSGVTYTYEQNEFVNETDKANSDNNMENTPSKCDNITYTPKEKSNDELNSVNTENVFNTEENDFDTVTIVKNARANVIDSSDEDDNIVSVNESIRADVHKDFKSDKANSKTVGSSLRKIGNNIDDDDILEINEDPENDKETNNLNAEDGSASILMNKEKSLTDVNLKQVTTEGDGLEDDGSENFEDKSLDLDGKECNNLDVNDDKENDSEIVITDNNTNDLGSTINSGITLCNVQEIENVKNDPIEGEQNQDKTAADVTLEGRSEKTVEINADELMDVDFDDDF